MRNQVELLNIKTTCFRDLTKKSKFCGLTPTCFGVFVVFGTISWLLFKFYIFFPLVAITYFLLFAMEFIDEDIFVIVDKSFKITPKKFYP